MNICDQLNSRARLSEWRAALGLTADASAVMMAYDDRTFFQPVNLAALTNCYQKAWLDGVRLAPEDLAGITIDRMVLVELLIMMLMPLIRAKHAQLGLPAAVTAETCAGLGHSFQVMTEFPEALIRSLHWTGKYHREIMFKTGIFVYHLTALSEKLPVWAFRERRSGRVVALAGDGVPVDAQGLVCGDDQAAPAFVTSLRRTPEEIDGNLIHPGGRIRKERRNLALAEWESVLAPGMFSAGIHIPPGRPMLTADCGASMRAASAIIRDHLAHVGAQCFTCMSWILNPDWLDLLPESNMAQFMREVYLFPLKSDPTAGIDFVFRKPASELDLQTAPRKSRLQRIMLEHLEQKKPLHAGGMFMPLDDVVHFGTQYYFSGGGAM